MDKHTENPVAQSLMDNLEELGEFEEVGIQASKVIEYVKGNIGSIVDEIENEYKLFCETEDGQKLNFDLQPGMVESNVRLTFECLCFCCFNCSGISGVFITERRLFRKRPNYQKVDKFNGALGYILLATCQELGATELPEILIEFNKDDLSIGYSYGDNLDPIKRLDEYLNLIESGDPKRVLENFGRYVGQALNPRHTALLSIIGGTKGLSIIELAETAMKSTFRGK